MGHMPALTKVEAFDHTEMGSACPLEASSRGCRPASNDDYLSLKRSDAAFMSSLSRTDDGHVRPPGIREVDAMNYEASCRLSELEDPNVLRTGRENREARHYPQVRLPEVRAKVERWFVVRAPQQRLSRACAGTRLPLARAAWRLTGRERRVSARPVCHRIRFEFVGTMGYWCGSLRTVCCRVAQAHRSRGSGDDV